jgi:DNA polymerase-3 subunit epsilon
MQNIIVLDIETSGLNPERNSMVSLGAVHYQSGEEFYGECRVQPMSKIDDFALTVNGFTKEQITDESKQKPEDLCVSFLQWASKWDKVLLAGQQVGSFDILFLKHIHETSHLTLTTKWPFGHRSLDLHSVAFSRYSKSLSLDGILEAVGLKAEVKPHNALNGARLETEAFKLLIGPSGWKS